MRTTLSGQDVARLRIRAVVLAVQEFCQPAARPEPRIEREYRRELHV